MLSQSRKDTLLRKLVSKAKSNGAQELKGRVVNDPLKQPLMFNGSAKKFEPDLIETVKDGGVNLYQIETSVRESEITDHIAKWILFSSYAKRHHGEFYLYVPTKKLEHVKELLSRKLISAHVFEIEK